MGNVRRISKKYYLRQIVACFLVSCLFFNTSVVLAVNPPATPGTLPSGGVVPGGYGSASFTLDLPNNNLTIGNLATQTVINWDSFDIGSLSSVNFDDTANFAVLNRVTGNTGTTGIYGDLFANGTIFVINTRGIVFGPDSYIQARNFVASGIDIRNDDFMNGFYQFERNFENPYSDWIGNVTNEGIGTGNGINAENIALIGRNVTNKGVIRTTASGGAVVMAAGDSVYLSEIGSNVSVEVSQGYTRPYERVVDNGGSLGTGDGTITATGGKVILAAGDIYSTAIEGVESLRAEATGDITLNGAIGATGHVEILGGQNRIISRHAQININEDITAGSMRIKNGKDVEPGEESLSGIYVAADKNLEATAGDVVVEAVHNVELGGDVTASGDVFINGDEDGWGDPKGAPEDYNPRPYGGGDVIANNITAGGDIEVKGNAIQLNGDVYANGGDLTITGRTSKDTYTDFSESGLDVEWGYIDVAEGKKLFASDDVIVKDAFGSGGDEPPAGKMDLFGHVSLEIEAEGGEIKTEGPWGPDGVKITVQNTSPVSLTLTQADPLNLVDYTFGNQENTDLTLVSYDGSVTAVDSSHPLSGKNDNAADQWKSIGATTLGVTDFTDITLQGHDLDNDITATALTSNNGNISVTSVNRKVLATGEINTNNGSVTLSADHPTTGGIELYADVTSGDFQDYIGDVELKNDITAESTGGSDITFTGTIDGTHGLTVNTAGVTKFQDEIGGNERLASLTTDAPGRTEIEADIYLNGASATFGDPVLLKNNLTIDEAGTGNIEFASTVDSEEGSNYTLTVNSGSGATIFGGAVGNDALDELSDDEGLGEVTTNAAGTTQINGGIVTTTGNQTYNDPVTLGAAYTTLNATNVTFDQTLDSDSGNNRVLNVLASGVTKFNGAVGATDPLGGLWTDGSGSTQINGGLVTTTSYQFYDDPVTLGADTTLNGQYVEFWNTLNSDSPGTPRNLLVNSSVETLFNAPVGGIAPLASLETDAPGRTYLFADVTTTGAQTYRDPVEIYDYDNVITTKSNNSGDITFAQTVDSAYTWWLSGPVGLSVETAGVTKFQGEVGGNNPLASLTTDAPGRTEIGAVNIHLNGASAKFNDPVLLMDNLTINEAGTGNIEFASTVDSEEGSNYTLTVNSGSGATIFGGAVGDNALGLLSDDEGLGAVTTNAAGSTQINGSKVKTTGDQTYNDPVTLGAADTDLYATNVTFDQTLNSDLGNNRGLDVYASGVTKFNGAVGATDPLYWLWTDGSGSTQINGGSVTTTYYQDHWDPVTLGADTTLNGPYVYFENTLNSDSTGTPRTLLVNSSEETLFGSTVGGIAPLASLETDAPGRTFIFADVTTTGAQTYRDPVEIQGGGDVITTKSNNSGDITFAQTVDSVYTWWLSGPVGLSVETAGVTRFQGEIGGNNPLASLTTDAPGRTEIGAVNIHLNGASAKFNDQVLLMDNLTINEAGTGNIEFASTVDSEEGSNYNLTVNSGSGATIFGGAVGSDALDLLSDDEGLGAVTTNAAGSTQINGGIVTTTGDQTYNDPVTLGARTILNATNVTFDKTLDSDSGNNRTLDVYASGVTKFNGAVGATDPLYWLYTDEYGSTQINGGSVTATYYQIYDDPVTLGADTTLNSEFVYFNDTLNSDSAGTPRTLLVNANQRTKFHKEVGGIAPLASLETDAPGWTELGADVTTTGPQTYNDDVDLIGDVIAESTDDDNITFAKTVDGAHNLTVNTAGNTRFAGNVGSEIKLVTLTTDAGGTTYVGGDVTTTSGITFGDNVIADGTGSPLDQTLTVENGTLTAEGWVWKTTAGNLYLLSNNDDPEHNNGKAIDLQYAGCLPAASTALGNLELYAENGDIQISGDLTTFGLWCEGRPEQANGDFLDGWYDRPTGGVSVIAENGKIYTDADSPDPAAGDYMLNIGIVGNSDDVSHRMYVNGENHVEIRMGPLGVDLPYGEGKAAIVVLSSDDLKFGPDTMLIAKGNYDSSVVDDRPGVGFLADPLTSIGGIIRDEGDPIDVAVYVGSMGTEEGQGNVHLDGRAIDVAQAGTMVVDAYDTVTFGDFETFNLEDFDGCEDLGCFLKKLAMRFHEDIDFEDLCGAFEDYVDQYGWYEGILEDFLNFYFDEGFFFNIDRLEVASRISEWLFQAVGRLPYAGDPAGIAAIEAFIGGDYILRGAGLGNPGIIDGRAWVLEDPLSPAPLYREAGEKAEEQAIGAEGCPALLTAVALELGIPEDELNVFMASAMAAATDIQPCESCARLVDAATILKDEDGSRMAAMIQVFNELAPAGAPFTPEMATSIVTAFAGHVDDGTYYATAIEYIDAFVQYIAVLDTEMGSPVGEGDSIAFVMEKHGAGITESDNANIGTFVATRLEGLETFGD